MSKKLITALCIGAATLFMGSPMVSAADLTINITNIKKSSGIIFVGVYDNSATFLSPKGIKKRMELKANTGGVSHTFEGLPEGDYAISGFHDEDGDGELKKNFLGIPQEPIGLSRDARGRFGPPEFSDAVFTLPQKGTELTITLY